MRRLLAVSVLALPVLLGACPRVADAAPAAPVMALALVPVPLADTIQVDVRWDAWVDDGRGPLDSIMVQVAHLTSGTGWLRSVLTPDMVGWSVRQAIPYVSATWEVVAQVCFYRRSRISCAEQTAQFTVEDTAPAAPRNLRLTVTVRPPGETES
jgi:hypothetical protein